MSEPLPPKLTTEPGTPAREWAHSTTTAAFARTEPTIDSFNPNTNPAPIHPTTAGVSLSSASDANKGAFDPSYVEADVPGAYPVTPGEHDPTRQTSLQDTARAASQQTSMFMQNVAVTAAQYLPQGVVDTVSSYIRKCSLSIAHRHICAHILTNFCQRPRLQPRPCPALAHLKTIKSTRPLCPPLSSLVQVTANVLEVSVLFPAPSTRLVSPSSPTSAIATSGTLPLPGQRPPSQAAHTCSKTASLASSLLRSRQSRQRSKLDSLSRTPLKMPRKR